MGSPSEPVGPRTARVGIDHVWVVVAIAVPTIGVLAGQMSTIDLAYQIRAGEWMLRTHEVLARDTFTFTAGGAGWLNQQWGAQVLLALIYRAGGFPAEAVARGALNVLGFGGVYLACRAAGASLTRAALLSLAAFGLSLYHLAMRPQMFAVALFGIALWLVEDRRRHPGRFAALPLVVVAWASIHGSFVLGPVLVGFAWLEDRRDHDPGARRTFWVGVATTLATLVNPFGVRVWTYAIGIGTNPTIRNLITEWRPTTATTGAGATFFASVALLVAYLARRREPVPWITLARFAVFFVLALPAIRGVLWWGMAAPVIVAELLPPRTRPVRIGIPAMNAILIGAVLLAVVVAAPHGLTTIQGKPLLQDAPAGLSNAVEAALPPGSRLFVSQRWGSWFEFVDPAMPVFVDARIEVEPTSVWHDYFSAGSGQEGWQAILTRWQVDAAVLSPRQDEPLIERMLGDPGWELLKHDAQGDVFVPTSSPAASGS